MANKGVGNKTDAKSPEELPVEFETHGGGERKGETAGEPAQMRMQPPFSRYRTSVGHENRQGRSGLPTSLTTADIKPPVAPGQGRTEQSGEDEANAGCCKCVIM
jgi:hypothetical protein